MLIIPLTAKLPLAKAFLPTLSCTIRMNKQAGKIVDEVIVKTRKGESPVPLIFFEIAS